MLKIPFSSRALSLSLLALLGACQSPTLSYAPVNKTIQTQLPDAGAATVSEQLFSFRLISPTENVSAFSVLQAQQNDPGVINLRQKTLPVEQLEEVRVAKEKILSSEYLQPQQATILAYETARIYSWDTEIARQIIVEIIDTYATRRNAEVKALRATAEIRALYFQRKAAAELMERQRQSDAVRDRLFGSIPNPQPITLAEQNENRTQYFQYIQDRLIKAQKAQEEYNKQAKAVLVRWQEERDEATRKAREKEEQAQRLRESAFKQILAEQGIPTIEPQNPPQPPRLNAGAAETFTTQAVSDTNTPYSLTALANGDFLLNAQAVLPATLSLKVKGFDLPVIVPVLPQTHNGRLLLSVEKDAQGRPLVKGGMDAISGFQFDMSGPVFVLKYLDDQHQDLTFTYPDGHQEHLDVQALQNMTYAETHQLKPESLQLSPEAHTQLKNEFGQLRYEFTPELEFLPPEQALDILSGLGLS
jgi:hypothetical protein